MAANFEKFGKLGFCFKFKGDELDREPPTKYRLLSEGEHAFTVVDYSFETSNNSGNNYVKVTMAVEDEDGEAWINDNFVCTEANMWKFATFFSAIGMWEGPDGVKARGMEEDTWDKAIGKTGRLINKHCMYNEKPRNEVKGYVKVLKPAVR